MPPVLLHITTDTEWQRAQAAGALCPESLTTEGFVHCSTPDQVAEVANRYFGDFAEVLLLVIDPDRIGCDLRFEDSYGRGQVYPHVYGPVPVEAVLELRRYRQVDGGFPDLRAAYSGGT